MDEYLARKGILINRDRMQNLMHRICLHAIYQKPRITCPLSHRSVQRLVNLKQVSRADQVCVI
jgi:aminoglycoside phosphotransferase